MPTIDLIRNTFSDHRPDILEIEARRAAVAMILRGDGKNVDMLMIRRAEHDGDPWSGDLAFPGGKVNFEDSSDRAAAEREAFEEIGVTLPAEAFIGQLDDISGAYVPVNVACFIYHLDRPVRFVLNREVTHYWWIPLSRFFETERHRYATFTYRNRHRARPVIDLVEPEFPFLWGITYRLVEQFFNHLGRPFPLDRNPES